MKSQQKKEKGGREKIRYKHTNNECDVYAAVVAWLYRNMGVDREKFIRTQLTIVQFLYDYLLPLHHTAVT